MPFKLPYSFEEWQAKTGIRKQRYVRFMRYLYEEASRLGDFEAAKLAAGKRMDWRSSGGYPLSDKVVARKVEQILSRPDINGANREMFAVSAGLYPHDVNRMVAKHILGEIEVTKHIQTKDGVETIVEKAPPSLDAAKLYYNLAMPKPAKQVNVDQRVLVAKTFVTDEPPAIRARVLEPKAIEQKNDA